MSDIQAINRQRALRIVTDLMAVIAIVVVSRVYTERIELFSDLACGDEGGYLHNGLEIFRQRLNPEYGPLYSLWYKALSLFQPDSIGLYYLNYRAITVLPALALYALLRASRVSSMWALAAALMSLILEANYHVWPKVCHLVVAVMFIGFTLVQVAREWRTKWLILTIFMLLSAYIRPEFFVTFIISAGVLIVWTIIACKRSGNFRSAILPGAVLLAALAIIAVVGRPIGQGNDRGVLAFGQHYARNWVRWHQDPRNPWTNFEDIIRPDFGTIHSVGEALRKNPNAFFHHVFYNLSVTPHELYILFGQTFPEDRLNIFLYHVGIALVLLVVLYRAVRLGRKASLAATRQALREHAVVLIGVAMILLPNILSLMVIAPRQHYLLVGGSVTLAGLLILVLRAVGPIDWRWNAVGVAIIACLSINLIQPMADTFNGNNNLVERKTVDFIRSLDIHDPVHLLEAQNGIAYYLDKNYTTVWVYNKAVPFNEFLKASSTSMIVVSDELVNDTRFIDDPEWQYFMAHLGEFGFSAVRIPEVDNRALIVSQRYYQFPPANAPIVKPDQTGVE